MRIMLTIIFILLPTVTLATPPERPAWWAQPVTGSKLENFYQVSTLLYRSAQPYEEGFRELQQHGIGEVLDLRLYHRDAPGADMNLSTHNTPLFAAGLDRKRVIDALNIIANARQPVLVHCLHGSDRTGAVIALYRVVCQDWSKQQAIEEMTQGDYGYHTMFANIPEFIRQTDVTALRQQVSGPACAAAN